MDAGIAIGGPAVSAAGVHPASAIRAVTVRALDIPLFEPFGISGGAQASAANVLVRIELADGTVGHGEAAPLPPYNGETQADALTALRSVTPWLRGRDAAAWQELGRAFQTRARPRSGSARCALETALVDALARQAGVSLTTFLAAEAPAAARRPAVRLETDMTVTTGTPAAATAAVRRIQRRGIRVIKVKIGGAGGPAHDLARLLAIRAAAPRAPLVLDGNAGLNRDDAFLLVRLLQAARITPAVLEQWLPKDDLAGMRRLRRESGWLVAADEAVTTAEDARRVVRARAADVINIKLMKAGLGEALEIARIARAGGVGLMIGGNVESVLAMTVSACFATALGGFRFADLDTPFFMSENPFRGGYRIRAGQISVAHLRAGHGVVPRVAA